MVSVQLSGGRLRTPPGFATKRRPWICRPSVSRMYFARPFVGPLNSHILYAKETVHLCVSVQSNDLERSMPSVPGPQVWAECS